MNELIYLKDFGTELNVCHRKERLNILPGTFIIDNLF